MPDPDRRTAASSPRRFVEGLAVATGAAVGFGVCVLGPWQLGRMAWREQERDVREEACASMGRIAASTRDTAREMAALERQTERRFRDSAASAADALAEERRRGTDADTGRISRIVGSIADGGRWAEERRRAAEEWDRLAAEAGAELAATSEACGVRHG